MRLMRWSNVCKDENMEVWKLEDTRPLIGHYKANGCGGLLECVSVRERSFLENSGNWMGDGVF